MASRAARWIASPLVIAPRQPRHPTEPRSRDDRSTMMWPVSPVVANVHRSSVPPSTMIPQETPVPINHADGSREPGYAPNRNSPRAERHWCRGAAVPLVHLAAPADALGRGAAPVRSLYLGGLRLTRLRARPPPAPRRARSCGSRGNEAPITRLGASARSTPATPIAGPTASIQRLGSQQAERLGTLGIRSTTRPPVTRRRALP